MMTAQGQVLFKLERPSSALLLWRSVSGLSQGDVGLRIGVHKATISALEIRGCTPATRTGTMTGLVELSGISPTTLYTVADSWLMEFGADGKVIRAVPNPGASDAVSLAS